MYYVLDSVTGLVCVIIACLDVSCVNNGGSPECIRNPHVDSRVIVVVVRSHRKLYDVSGDIPVYNLTLFGVTKHGRCNSSMC